MGNLSDEWSVVQSCGPQGSMISGEHGKKSRWWRSTTFYRLLLLSPTLFLAQCLLCTLSCCFHIHTYMYTSYGVMNCILPTVQTHTHTHTHKHTSTCAYIQLYPLNSSWISSLVLICLTWRCCISLLYTYVRRCTVVLLSKLRLGPWVPALTWVCSVMCHLNGVWDCRLSTPLPLS